MQRLSTILIVLALAAPPASAFAGQQTQAERERQQQQQQREREQAQRDRERAQREEQQERERAQRERQQERERAQRERDRERNQDRQNAVRDTQTEQISRTVNIGANGELDISNIAGDIRVTRGSGTTALIEVTKTARGEDPRSVLPLVSIDITERGNRAEVRTRYPSRDELGRGNRRNINVTVSYTIAAPQNTRLILKSISGDLTVRDISGAMTLESTSGSVRVANAGATVSAKSISGDIEAVDTRIDGTLEAITISGAVRVRRTSVRSVSSSSVSGDVLLEDVVCDQIKGQSISGQVVFMGELSPNGRYDLTAHSGTVRVALGGKTGFQLEATSFSGTINSDFPLTMQGTGGRNPRNIRATYGNGAASLDLNAFSGSILITKR